MNVEDRGFQLGDGIYEVVKVMNGQPVWLEDHLDACATASRPSGWIDTLAEHRPREVLPELGGAVRSGGRHGVCPGDSGVRSHGSSSFPDPPAVRPFWHMLGRSEFPTAG